MISETMELKSEINKFDCVIEACGNSEAFVSGVPLLKPGGVYMLVGMVHPNTKLDLTGEQVVRKCLTIVGIHNYQDRHLEYAVKFLTRSLHKFPFEYVLAPRKFTLDELPQAIEYAKEKHFPRVCVRP